MKKDFLEDKKWIERDLYALEITLLIMGFLLFRFPSHIISDEVQFCIRQIVFASAIVVLLLIAVKLEKKGISGLRQIAMGMMYIFMYVLFPSLSQRGWGVISFIVIGFSVFNIIRGMMALADSFIQQKQKNEEEKLIFRVESVVVIFTSIMSVLLSALQMLSK